MVVLKRIFGKGEEIYLKPLVAVFLSPRICQVVLTLFATANVAKRLLKAFRYPRASGRSLADPDYFVPRTKDVYAPLGCSGRFPPVYKSVLIQ